MFKSSVASARDKFFVIVLLCCLLFVETTWQMALAATDAARYQCYALIFWFGSRAISWLPKTQCALMHLPAGQLPFHVLPLEYPPLTLLPFSIPLLVPVVYYTLAYGLLMLLIAACVGWLLLRFGPPISLQLFVLYLVLGACVTFQVRYDLLPALCTLICIIAAERRRWLTAYLVLALGVLLKLYPLVLLPVLFIGQQQLEERLYLSSERLTPRTLPLHLWRTVRGIWRWQWRHLLIFVGLVLGVSGLFALINVQDAVIHPVQYFVQRPPQIESLDGTLLWLMHMVGEPWRVVYTYGSINIISSSMGGVALLGTCLLLLGLVIAFGLQWLRRLDLAQASIAVLLILVATGKVFSPQYLLWIIPLLAYAGGSGRRWVGGWSVISLLTTCIYALFYSRLPDAASAPQVLQTLPGFFELVAVRNLLIVLAALAYLCNWWRVRA